MGGQGSKDAGVSEEIKTYVDTTIAGKKVVIFSKTYCPYCNRTKTAVSEHVPGDCSENDIDVIELDNRQDGDEIQKYLKSITGASTVPRVFVNGKSVGGCDDLTAIHTNGQLSTMLKA